MITNASILKNIGLPVGNLETGRIDAAIAEAELGIVKQAIGDANYIALHSMCGNWMNGGVVTDAKGVQHYVAGFNAAISYIAFAHLLRHTITATAFGSVVKTDENSNPAQIWDEAKYYFNVGWQYLRDTAAANGWSVKNGHNYFNAAL